MSEFFNVVEGDLFDTDFSIWTPAHCISADCKMGAGIAVPMKRKFNLYGLIDTKDFFKIGSCEYYNGVFNLITKEHFYDKPTYESLTNSLIEMRNHATKNGITKIVMPKIGCGLDRLKWTKVKQIILDQICSADISVLVKVK